MFTRTFTNVHLCQIKIHRLIHVYLFRLGVFHILQHKVTVKHKPKTAEVDIKQALKFPHLNKPEAVHGWFSVRGRFTYEILLLRRISRILMLV